MTRLVFTLLFCFGVTYQVGGQSLDLDIFSDERPDDARFQDLKDLNGYFPLQVPTSQAAWTARADQVRKQILVACGIWPMPARPEVDATIHGKVDRDEYTVEKVFFESYPGLFVTGNLYRPKGKAGKRPVVLSPHGHWSEGRFYKCPEDQVVEQIFEGAERHESGARYPLQARCVHLARMGCIVFHYDMLGYADSKPITYERAHRHRDPRPELEGTDAWGLFTAQAEMRMQSVFGMQTFNSLRALDFVVGLPDVDPSRIGVTGASGGGTQTMILAAIEPRVQVSFPAVMVSTAMQGGCTCENACCLRVGTGNVEFAGLFCPKPQGINAADDWTVELATKGMPELQKLYKLFGADQKVEGYPLVQFPHNYNHVSRGKMYAWFNQHFQLGYSPRDLLEREFEPLSTAEMSVWNERYPAPDADLPAEQTLLKQISDLSQRQLTELGVDERNTVVRQSLEVLTDVSWDSITRPERENLTKTDQGNYWLFKDILRYDHRELPVIFLHPKSWNEEVVVWTAEAGKASLLDDEGALRSAAQGLLQAGFAIAAPDLFRQGEFESQGAVTETRKVKNNRDFAGYTFGYNPTLLAYRTQDLLALLKFIATDEHGASSTHLLGIEGATSVSSVAAALAGNKIEQLVVDDGKFQFQQIRSWRDPNFLPGVVKYGDIAQLHALAHHVRANDSADQAVQSLVSSADSTTAKP